MSKKANLYIGRAGHLAVMAEFLWRGWNTAIPEVDVGDDIFVVRDQDGDFSRVQVKAATGVRRQYGFSAQFSISRVQLITPVTPELTYVFVVRYENRWAAFMVIERTALEEEHMLNDVGSVRGNYVQLYLQFREGNVRCGDADLSQYLNNWDRYPVITH